MLGELGGPCVNFDKIQKWMKFERIFYKLYLLLDHQIFSTANVEVSIRNVEAPSSLD